MQLTSPSGASATGLIDFLAEELALPVGRHASSRTTVKEVRSSARRLRCGDACNCRFLDDLRRAIAWWRAAFLVRQPAHVIRRDDGRVQHPRVGQARAGGQEEEKRERRFFHVSRRRRTIQATIATSQKRVRVPRAHVVSQCIQPEEAAGREGEADRKERRTRRRTFRLLAYARARCEREPICRPGLEDGQEVPVRATHRGYPSEFPATFAPTSDRA